MFQIRSSSALAAAILTVSGLALAPPPAYAAASCSGITAQDFDDDGHADLVAARKVPSSGAGVVDLVLTGGGTQTISATDLGFASAADDQFGASIQIANLDTVDNCPDLVIGSPGAAGGGAAYLVRGNASGVSTSAVRLVAPSPHTRFGTSAGSVWLSFSGPRVLVGAPGLDVGSTTDAGGILVWNLDDDGVPVGQPVTLTYADFGAAPAKADLLGSVMHTGGTATTLGVPDRDVGAAKYAGEVVTFSFVYQPDPIQVYTSSRVNQNSPGAPGVAEAGDRFGASVDADALVLVGVPGEDIGGRADAGCVMRFHGVGGDSVSGWTSWTQDSPGIPGVAEAGDRFGAAVQLAWVEVIVDGDPIGRPVYVAAAPGEDIGSVRNAGAITVIAPGVRPAFGLSQGSGLPGAAERNDQVGAVLGDLPGEYDGPYYGGDGLVVGVPGEDIGTVADSGLVLSTRGLLPKGTYPWVSNTPASGPTAGARYGWSLPKAS